LHDPAATSRVSSYDAPIMGKWLQLLKEVAPSVTHVTVIFNPDTAFAASSNREKPRSSQLAVLDGDAHA